MKPKNKFLSRHARPESPCQPRNGKSPKLTVINEDPPPRACETRVPEQPRRTPVRPRSQEGTWLNQSDSTTESSCNGALARMQRAARQSWRRGEPPRVCLVSGPTRVEAPRRPWVRITDVISPTAAQRTAQTKRNMKQVTGTTGERE